MIGPLHIAGITLIVGAFGGTVVGFELSSKFWHQMLRGTVAFPGILADKRHHNALMDAR
jgi:hypothetical protein